MKFEKPDSHIDHLLNNPEYLHPLIAEAVTKAREIKEKDAIKTKPFEDPNVYGLEAVLRDNEFVQSMKEKFAPEDEAHKKYADVFEAIFYKQAEMSNWLGENIHTILTSPFDDIKNGIDVIIRLNESLRPFPYVGMGIDVTFGRTNIKKKLDRVFEEIKDGKLGTMRYFMDPDYAPFKGSLSGIPHIIVGVERRHVVELAGQWLRGEKQKLGDNPIQLVILEQIMAQLKAFRDYAESLGKPDIVEIFDADISVFAPVLLEKEKMGLDTSDYENDPVMGEIIHGIEMRKMG